MIFVKFIILAAVFGTSSLIGIKLASGYKVRANNLKQMKKALKILEAKITYTYDKLPDLFLEISNKIGGDVGNLFFDVGRNMQLEFAGEAWEQCIEKSNLSITHDDKEALKSLGKLLGSTNMQGQLEQLHLVNDFLDEQIKEAVESKKKNETMYKKLGVIVGLAVVIVLI
ncbi:MAG: stage III sporulation protein AB [Clostridia bacterium]|nr:stage III sporulation protein AB [Clostridia bacterium]